VLSEKFYRYMGLSSSYENTVTQRMRERFSVEELEKLDEMLHIISTELMPECDK